MDFRYVGGATGMPGGRGSIMCATVRSRAARAATLSSLERKRSSFEAKTPHLALKGVESSLLEV